MVSKTLRHDSKSKKNCKTSYWRLNNGVRVSKQKYEEAAYNRDKEKLLKREMARLRVKLQLGGEIEKE